MQFTATRVVLAYLALQLLHAQLGAEAKLQRRIENKDSASHRLFLDVYPGHDSGVNVTDQQLLIAKAVKGFDNDNDKNFPGQGIKDGIASKFEGLKKENRRDNLVPERHHKGEVPEQFKAYIHEYENHLEKGKPVKESQKLAAKAVMDKQHSIREKRVGSFPAVAIALILAVPVGFSIGGTVCYAKTRSA